MNDFTDEVDEAVRRDKQSELLKKYGPLFTGVAIAIVVGVGGIKGYENWQFKTHQAASTQYEAAITALDNGDMENAKSAFEKITAEAPDTYKSMAYVQLAGLALADEQPDQAIKAFDQAAAVGKDPLVTDVAKLKAAYILADTNQDEAIKRLSAISDDGPYRHSAQELKATLLMDDQPEEARKIFERLRLALDAPDSLRERAEVTLAMLPAPAGDDATAEITKDETPTPEDTQ